MNHSKKILLLIVLLFFYKNTYCKKVLVFDEKKGIIWVEEGKKKKKESFKMPSIGKKKRIITENKTVKIRRHVKTKPVTAYEYKSTGIKFYNGKDYVEAAKYFQKAIAVKKDPLYYFWLGACYRNMNKQKEMRSVFNKIIRIYPKSSVADDAYFYLAIEAHKSGDYELAFNKYREVVELYPDGASEIGNLPFRQAAKKQLRAMKIDLLSRLKLLNYTDNNALELLKSFQKKNKLRATGKPDKKTVKLLIKKSDKAESQIEQRIERSGIISVKHTVYLLLLNILLFINIIWGIVNLKSSNREIKRIKTIKKDLE